MAQLTRRAALTSGATVATLALAGCLSVPSGGDGEAGASPSPPEGSGIRLETLAVGGSSGTTMRVRPPGEVVLLDFWATWCAPCKPQMAELRVIRDEFPDLHMLSITNENDVGAIEAFWREYDGTWPVASDPSLETNDEFGVTRIPTLLVFDPEGVEVWRHVGLAAADTIANRLREAGA